MGFQGAPTRTDTHRHVPFAYKITFQNKNFKRIALCAHYDTTIDTPGASDNGSGLSVLLGLADFLSKKELDCSLEFIAFSAEEYYGMCDEIYIRHCGDQLPYIIAAINMDGIGQKLGTTTVTVAKGSEPFRIAVKEQVKRYPGILCVPPIALSSKGVPNLAHSHWDSIEWISETKLMEAASIIIDIIEELTHY